MASLPCCWPPAGGGYYFNKTVRSKNPIDQFNKISVDSIFVEGKYCYKGDWESSRHAAQPCKLEFEKKDGNLIDCAYTNLRWNFRIPLNGTIQNDTLHFVDDIQGKQLVIDLKITDNGNTLVGEGIDHAQSDDKAKLNLTKAENEESALANQNDESIQKTNNRMNDDKDTEYQAQQLSDNEYDNNNASNEYYGSDNSSSAPQWVQGTWKHNLTAPMVGIVASYTLDVSGNTITFYRNGEMQYRDEFTYQNGRLVGQHGSFIVNESAQRLADETGRCDKIGDSSSSGSGSSRFSTAYDVIGYLFGRTFRETSSGSSLQIRQDGCYVNGQYMTGAPRVDSFTSTNAVVRASFIPSGTITFYLDSQSGTIIDSNGNKYQ